MKDVNAVTDEDHWNLLHLSLVSIYESPSHEALELLVASGVNVDAQDQEGFTPLHFASRKKDLSSMELLLQNGADPNPVNAQGVTALQLCLKEKPVSIEAVRVLLEYGADPDAGEYGSARKLVDGAEFPEKKAVLDLFSKTKERGD
ncbi:ankyrin repeat domain-containing protein [Stieleria neptunia]|nr:ankyrin repeat domain-containing protein [Stieleria neptunia]